MTEPLNHAAVRHLARLIDEAARHEASRIQVVDQTGGPYGVLNSRTLTQDEVSAYTVAALDVARTQLAPLAEPGAVRVELAEDVHERTWDDLAYRPHVREHLRARWARDLERANLRPSTWPPITATPDYDRGTVRLSIAGLAVPIPTKERHP